MTHENVRTFTVKTAAAYLNVHPETIRRAYRKGELVGTKDELHMGQPLLFLQSNLDAFKLAKQRSNA